MAQLFDPRTMSGWCLYGGAALLYIIALRRIPMSVALPCTAVSYVAAALDRPLRLCRTDGRDAGGCHRDDLRRRGGAGAGLTVRPRRRYRPVPIVNAP